MQLCSICLNYFKPPQTFYSLFHTTKYCEVCGLIKETPLSKAILPIDYSECHIYSSKRANHPAIFNNVMVELVCLQKGEILFIDMVNDHIINPWPLLSKLFDPLIIYTPKMLTLDEMEKIIA